MVSRAIFYDKCNDGQRLLAEWIQTTVNWSVVQYDGKFCYTEPNATSSSLIWSAIGKLSDLEMTFLLGTQGLDIGIIIRKRDNVGPYSDGDLHVLVTAANLLAYERYAGVWNLLISVAHGVVLPLATGLFWFKTRMVGNRLLSKIWLKTSPEPGWILSTYATYQRFGCNKNGFVGLHTGGTGPKYVSDIRVTPIPRTGGP
jgi:hypothetical protein